MQTIIIVLDSNKMENPDLDIRYLLPDRIEEFTNGLARDNGYDYLDDARLGIWLETEDAEVCASKIIELIKAEKIIDNDLSRSAEIFVSEEDCAEIEKCRKVY